MEPTHYQVLEIDQKATFLQIRKKYLEMAILYHPDKNRHLPKDQYLKTEHKFQQVTNAFNILSDPEQRKKYDQQIERLKNLEKLKKEKVNNPPSFCAYKNGSYSFNVSPIILEFANQLFSNQRIQNLKDFAGIFTQFTSKSGLDQNDTNLPEIIRNYKKFYKRKEQERQEAEQRYQSQMVRKPKKQTVQKPPPKFNHRQNLENPILRNSEDDLVYTANVSLRDIYLNIPKELNVPRKRVCHHCLGVGYLGYGADMSLCQICKGLMIISDSKVFQLDIKKSKLIFEKEGNQRLEHLPGDLIIYIQPKPNTQYRIINQTDLLYSYPISLIELYQDLEINLEHLDGQNYNFHYQAQDINALKDKRLLKITGKGLLKDDSENRGDLYLQLEVQFPDLTRTDLENLKSILGSNQKKENKIENVINLESQLADQSYQIDA